MEIKRVATLLLAFSFLVLPTGCKDSSDSGESFGNSSSSSYYPWGNESDSESSNNGKSDSEDDEEDSGNKIVGKITDAMGYSENLAFISQSGKTCPLNICIDRQGNEIFRLGEEDACRAGFTNGNAFVTIDGEDCLVNKQGEIVVSPEKSGYTWSFRHEADASFDYQKAYYDGYFPVYHKEVSFSGEIIHKYGVLGADGTWKLELSEEYFDGKYCDWYSNRIREYGNGFIHIGDNWWNLETGELTDSPDFDDYLPTATDCSTFKEKYPTISAMGNFLSGAAYTYVEFYVDGTYFFSLIGRDGELIFEPFEVQYYYSTQACIDMDERAGVICAIKTDGTLLVYNVDGTLKREFSKFITADYSTIAGLTVKACLGEELYVINETLPAYGAGYHPMNSYFINVQGEVILGNK